MTAKRGDIKKFKGLLGRVTFVDKATGYVRLEHNDFWKAAGFLKEMSDPTPREIEVYEMDALLLHKSIEELEKGAEEAASRWG